MHLIIDTDPGVDDAHALMAALAHPDAEVGAIITVVGNVPLVRTTANACTILDAMDSDVPVYAGCAQPLIQESSWATEFHGKDGLGDAGLVPSTRAIEAEHGVDALVRMATESPGEWTLRVSLQQMLSWPCSMARRSMTVWPVRSDSSTDCSAPIRPRRASSA